MSSTYSPDLRIELIGTGDQAGVWGNTTNTNLNTILESAIAGYTSVSITSANQNLTANFGAADQARFAAIALTTTTVANFAVYAPPASKLYTIYNASIYVATIYNSTVIGNTTAAGTGVAIPAGKTMTIWSDGTNFTQQNTHLISPTVAGGTLTSPTLVTPALGTPTSGTLTNATGLPISTGVSGLGTGVATFLATPTAANLATAVVGETGSGNLVFATSPTLVTPALGTPASGVMTNVTGLPLTSGVTGILPIANGGVGTASFTGTGNNVFSNSPTLVTPTLGTPASATLTNATGLPVATGISGLGTGVATFLATPSSANLASAVTGETGSGALVFATSPTLVTPALGTPSALVGTNISGTAANLTAGDSAKLNNQSAAYYQTALGFTPVQQGGGANQDTNKLYVGWGTGRLRLQVDVSDQGPIVLDQDFTSAGNRNLGANGYQVFPGGLTIQWGYFDQTGTTTGVNFTKVFPNACYGVNITITNNAGSISAPGVANITQSGFNCLRDSAAPNTGIFWTAFGI